ncbi:MAG: signal peptidase I [Erysipelotrichales bacterium]|nr:signal peptidase I [Erysipelotrichales bacterium]
MNQEKKKEILAEIWDYVKTIAITFICVMLITHFIVRPVEVEGSSMYPTLTDGERAFSGLITRTLHAPERFEIVTAYLDVRDELLVKRVIGLPGETVEFRDEVLYINGEPVAQDFLDEEYMKSDMASYGRSYFTADYGPVTLGEDEYFLCGDNRPHSGDSRVFGPFSAKDIQTTGILVFWPFGSFGIKK